MPRNGLNEFSPWPKNAKGNNLVAAMTKWFFGLVEGKHPTTIQRKSLYIPDTNSKHFYFFFTVFSEKKSLSPPLLKIEQ